jgi:carboxyl-terminal processing protease
MKRFLVGLLAVTTLSISSVAGAQKFIGSPAQDLFDQASFYLEQYYFGPSQVNIVALVAKYQVQLDAACETQGLVCPYVVAEPILSVMFDELGDAHAGYLPAQALAAEQAATNNQTSPVLRLGITSTRISPDSYDRLITDVLEDGPADKAGVLYGDRWVGFDGQAWPNDDQGFVAANERFTAAIRAARSVVMNLVRGPEKTRVNIEVKGEVIPGRPRVRWNLRSDGVGVITIKDFFPQGTGAAVHAAVRQAQLRNAQGIVLDLRGNGGGQLSESAITAGAFLETPITEVLTPRHNAERDRVTYNYHRGVFTVLNANNAELARGVIEGSTVWTGKLVVLIDQNSTSATERVAYQIQRAKRGVLIGQESTGVNDTDSFRFPLVNGGAAAMPRVRSFNPDGTPFPSSVKPDIVVSDMLLTLFNAGRDPGFERALESLRAPSAASSDVSRAAFPAPLTVFPRGW